jgi:hypothetical protein
MAHEVFISHAAEDKRHAEVVRKALEDAGIKCWIAPRDVPLGANYEEAIIDAIIACPQMVLIISASSNKSPHVTREIQNACLEDSPTQILPVRVDTAPLNKALRYYLSSLQWLDASTSPLEDHLEELVANVRSRQLIRTEGATFSGSMRAIKESSAMKTMPAEPYTGKSTGGIMQQKKLLMAIAAAVVVLAAAGIFWAYKSKNRNQSGAISQLPSNQSTLPVNQSYLNSNNGSNTGAVKLYRNMTQMEREAFIQQEAPKITAKLGVNPRPLNSRALEEIQYWVDNYTNRVGNESHEESKTDTRFIFQEGAKFAPSIIKNFQDRGVPPIVGLYLPAMRAEYKNTLCTPNEKEKGLFQFSLTTAQEIGLRPEDFCNDEKSIQLAAVYMSRLIRDFGKDATGVTLAIYCFNHKPEEVRRDLDKVADSPEKERSFWTLVAEENKLDKEARERLDDVPLFYAAAIVGENPQVFGLQTKPLSQYTE